MLFNLKTTEMHTGSQASRIIESGLPEIVGKTIFEKQKYVSEKLNYISKIWFSEPRGHDSMVGIIIIPSDVLGADFACMVFSKNINLPMCGDAVIAVGRYAVDRGIVAKPSDSEAKLVIQLPCGLIETFVETTNGKAGRVRFLSVPSFVYAQGVVAEVPGYGHVTVDISYGGIFYAIVPAKSIGLDVKTSATEELVQAGDSITKALRKVIQCTHPNWDTSVEVHGTILTDGNDEYSVKETSHISMYGDKKFCRSPSGSTSTARVALQIARGDLQLNQIRSFRGPNNSDFQARAVRHTKCGSYDAVIVEITGKAHYTGSSTFMLEDDDELGQELFYK